MKINYLVEAEIVKNKLKATTLGEIRDIALMMIVNYEQRLQSYDKETLGYTLLMGDINKINDWLKEIDELSDREIVYL